MKHTIKKKRKESKNRNRETTPNPFEETYETKKST